jgi:hypothetical protein
MLLWFEKEFVFRGIGGCGPLFYFKIVRVCVKTGFCAFLAYFQILKKYAIVRTMSVRLSVADSTPQGIDRSRSFLTQSIAYDPRT